MNSLTIFLVGIALTAADEAVTEGRYVNSIDHFEVSWDFEMWADYFDWEDSLSGEPSVNGFEAAKERQRLSIKKLREVLDKASWEPVLTLSYVN